MFLSIIEQMTKLSHTANTNYRQIEKYYNFVDGKNHPGFCMNVMRDEEGNSPKPHRTNSYRIASNVYYACCQGYAELASNLSDIVTYSNEAISMFRANFQSYHLELMEYMPKIPLKNVIYLCFESRRYQVNNHSANIPETIDLSNLKSRLKDESFKTAIFNLSSNLNHIGNIPYEFFEPLCAFYQAICDLDKVLSCNSLADIESYTTELIQILSDLLNKQGYDLSTVETACTNALIQIKKTEPNTEAPNSLISLLERYEQCPKVINHRRNKDPLSELTQFFYNTKDTLFISRFKESYEQLTKSVPKLDGCESFFVFPAKAGISAVLTSRMVPDNNHGNSTRPLTNLQPIPSLNNISSGSTNMPLEKDQPSTSFKKTPKFYTELKLLINKCNKFSQLAIENPDNPDFQQAQTQMNNIIEQLRSLCINYEFGNLNQADLKMKVSLCIHNPEARGILDKHRSPKVAEFLAILKNILGVLGLFIPIIINKGFFTKNPTKSSQILDQFEKSISDMSLS